MVTGSPRLLENTENGFWNIAFSPRCSRHPTLPHSFFDQTETEELYLPYKEEVPKYASILDFDRVLGLNLDQLDKEEVLPEAVQKLADARTKAREAKDFATSDRLRAEIEVLGYMVQDTKEGMKVIKK